MPGKKKKLQSVVLLKEQGQWFYLLHALILLLLLYPFFETPAEARMPLPIAFLHSIVVLAIIYATADTWRGFALGVCLGAPTLTFLWLQLGEVYPIGRMALLALVYAYAIFNIAVHLLSSKKVTFDEVFAAASMYILLGILWANLYQIVNFLIPGSFHLDDAKNLDLVFNWSDFIFYSFTTLTTLGYGDITPVTSHARSLSILEAVTGVIFLSVMVAKTMGLYLAEVIKKQSEKMEEEIEKELENIPKNHEK